MNLQKIFLIAYLCILPHLNAFSEEAKCSLEVVSTSLEKQQSGTGDLELQFHNLPKNQELLLLVSRAIQKNPKEFRHVDTITAENDDSFFIKGQKFTTYGLDSKVLFKGERVIYKLQLKDGPVIAETDCVPLPLYKKGYLGTFSISAELISIAPTTNYLIRFQNLQNNETVQLESESGNEKISDKIRVPAASGFMYMPGVVTADGGASRLTVTRSNGDQAILKLSWGTRLIREQLEASNNI